MAWQDLIPLQLVPGAGGVSGLFGQPPQQTPLNFEPEKPSFPELIAQIAAVGLSAAGSPLGPMVGVLGNLLGDSREQRSKMAQQRQLGSIFGGDPQFSQMLALGGDPSLISAYTKLQQQKQLQQILGGGGAFGAPGATVEPPTDPGAAPIASALAPSSSPLASSAPSMPGAPVDQRALYMKLAALENLGLHHTTAMGALGMPMPTGGGSHYANANEALGAATLGTDPATGMPRAPRTDEEWRKLNTAYDTRISQQAGARTMETEQAKRSVAGESFNLEKPVMQTLSMWGIDPTTASQPAVQDAVEATGWMKERAKQRPKEADLKAAVDEAIQAIPRLKKQVARMQSAGLPMDLETLTKQGAKYTGLTSENQFAKLGTAYLAGAPGPEYEKLFRIIGQVRTRLAKPYSGNMRAYQWLVKSQQHLPQVGGQDGNSIVKSVITVEPLLATMQQRLRPESDPYRKGQIDRLMYETQPDGTRARRLDGDTGKPIARSRVEYLVDRLMQEEKPPDMVDAPGDE